MRHGDSIATKGWRAWPHACPGTHQRPSSLTRACVVCSPPGHSSTNQCSSSSPYMEAVKPIPFVPSVHPLITSKGVGLGFSPTSSSTDKHLTVPPSARVEWLRTREPFLLGKTRTATLPTRMSPETRAPCECVHLCRVKTQLMIDAGSLKPDDTRLWAKHGAAVQSHS